MIKLFIGIDAGVMGATAVLDEYGELVAYRTLPHRKNGKRSEFDGDAFAGWMTSEVLMPTNTKPHQCEVVVEESPPFGMGVVSAYTSGYNNGRLHERLMQIFHKRPQRISARTWQKEVYGRPTKREDDKKAMSIAHAKEKHGELSGAFNVKKYADGIADAINIAEYCIMRTKSEKS